METTPERKFDKYETRGNFHWKEFLSNDIRVYNAYHQSRHKWILKIAGSVRGKKVLDAGCGDGLLTYFLAKAGADVTGIDNEEQGLQFADKHLALMNSDKSLKYAFVNASVYQIPFPDESFDIVVSCEVIEHIPKPEKMVAEIARVLKRGGTFILTTPYRVTEFPSDPNHVREYFPSEMQTMLGTHFQNITVKLTHHMLWRSMYAYACRRFGNRPLGKWFLNTLVLLFRWDPFMINYEKPGKFDLFATICARGIKS